MDSTKDKSGNGIDGENGKSRVDSAKRDESNNGESTKDGDGKEHPVAAKWIHGQRVSNDELTGFLNMLKDNVEKSIKQTEDQINEYRGILRSFKP